MKEWRVVWARGRYADPDDLSKLIPERQRFRLYQQEWSAQQFLAWLTANCNACTECGAGPTYLGSGRMCGRTLAYARLESRDVGQWVDDEKEQT